MRASRTGLSEATRLLQEVERPVLIVCAEKFSDKIGAVRTSRMIFGDGASALVVGPAEAGGAGDVDVLQSYASGLASEVNSIIWPNPEFDNVTSRSTAPRSALAAATSCR